MTTIIGDTEERADERASGQYALESSGEGTTLEHTTEQSTREATICVVGLGYVGLPLAVGFAQSDYRVIGYDVDDVTVDRLQEGIDTTGDLTDEAIQDGDISYTTDATTITEADYVIIAVPTPIDDDEQPDLGYVESAATTVGSKLDPGTTVVLESTVYPGSTREVLVPALEDASGLSAGEDFFVGYSPERATPADNDHGLEDVVKVVGAQNDTVLEDVATLYESVVDAGVHPAPSIEVAEACKVIENIQRDVNIALVNELSMAFEQMGLDTREVLEAARTKWNFHDYRPGLVGGHCIPVDPFYIIYESERNGFSPKLIEQAREVNEYMPEHVAEETLKGLNQCGKVLRDSTVLVLGLAYKPNVGDIRTSVVGGSIEKLETYGVDVVGYDPHAEDEAAAEEFGIEVQEELDFEGVDGVLLATPHDEFLEIDFETATSPLADQPLLIDVMGVFHPDEYKTSPIQYRRI